MTDAREALLDRVIAAAMRDGLADRSLRDLAQAADTSHRMLLYHFESRAGLVSAVVERVERAQREAVVEMSADAIDSSDLIRRLWAQVSSDELRPLVRLFFDCVAATGGEGLTDPWLELGGHISEKVGEAFETDMLRLGVAVTRGLLIDVLATGDTEPATRSLERFIELWESASV